MDAKLKTTDVYFLWLENCTSALHYAEQNNSKKQTYADGDVPRLVCSSMEPLDSTPSSRLMPSMLLGGEWCSLKSV